MALEETSQLETGSAVYGVLLATPSTPQFCYNLGVTTGVVLERQPPCRHLVDLVEEPV